MLLGRKEEYWLSCNCRCNLCVHKFISLYECF